MSLVSEKPITYLITRGEATSENFASAKQQILDIIALAVEEKVSLIQIREKHLTALLLCELTESAVSVTRGSSTKVLVNDRADIAMACGADGVHLTSNSIPVNVIRSMVPADFLVGISSHSLDDAMAAAQDGADFAVLAPVFDTPGKGEPLGIDMLAEVCRATQPFPILALGGTNERNLAEVLRAGASGFAAIRAMNEPDRLKQLMRMVRSQ